MCDDVFYLNSGQLLFGNTLDSYTFAMLSFQRQMRALTFSWTQCSSLTPSLSYCGRKLQTFELVRENSSCVDNLYYAARFGQTG